MIHILNIDTALETAQVSIASDGKVLAKMENQNAREHAAFLHVAIDSLIKNAGISLTEIDAVAVSAGPGSYTGLRVGMASAKGLCYALQKPMICTGSLRILAQSAILQCSQPPNRQGTLVIPMIDARRMEVYYSVFDMDLKELQPPRALVLEPGSFSSFQEKNRVLFTGNAVRKWKPLCTHENADFQEESILAGAMAQLSFRQFEENDLCSVAYAGPVYLKGMDWPPEKITG